MSFLVEPLQIISRIAPERVTMTVRGEIDMATAQQFRHEMTDFLSHSAMLQLDLSGVTFMDSTGVQAMLVVHRTARLLGGDLVITRTSPQWLGWWTSLGFDSSGRRLAHRMALPPRRRPGPSLAAAGCQQSPPAHRSVLHLRRLAELVLQLLFVIGHDVERPCKSTSRSLG
jgi:anti-anti-sigma factor